MSRKSKSLVSVGLLTAAAAAWVVATVGCGERGQGAARQPKPAAKPAEANAPVSAEGLVPISLQLPKPSDIGTPKEPPPGTRVKIPKGGKWALRKPFLAPKGVRNVALNKPVTSSDAEPVIGTLDLITDGCKEAVEDAFVELGYDVQWVQIDLERACRIHAVVVWHEHKDRRVYHDVVVQVADDRDFITNVRTLFNNDHDNSAGLGLGEDWGYFETHEGLLIDVQGVQARYVRLYSNGSTSDEMNRYTEVEVYALPAGPDAPPAPGR